MPSFRTKFTGLLKYLGPKASEEIVNQSPSPSASSLDSNLGNCVTVHRVSDNIQIPHGSHFSMGQMEISGSFDSSNIGSGAYNAWVAATFFFSSYYDKDLTSIFSNLNTLSQENCLTIMPPITKKVEGDAVKYSGTPGQLEAGHELQRNVLMPDGAWRPSMQGLKRDISINNAPANDNSQATLGKDGNLAYAQSFTQTDSGTFTLNPVKEGIHKIKAIFPGSDQIGSPDLGTFPALGNSTITVNVATLSLKLTQQASNNQTQEVPNYDNTNNTLISVTANQEKTYQAQWLLTGDFTQNNTIQTKPINDVLGSGNLNATIKLEYLDGQPEVYFAVCPSTNPNDSCTITEDDTHRLTPDRKDLTFTNNQSTIKLKTKTSGKFKLIFQPKVDNINSSLGNSTIREMVVKVEGQGETSTNGCYYAERTQEPQLYANGLINNNELASQQNINSTINTNPLTNFLKINRVRAEENNQTDNSGSQESGTCEAWTSPSVNQIDKDLYYSNDYLSHENKKMLDLHIKYKPKKSSGQIIIKSSVSIGSPGSDKAIIVDHNNLSGATRESEAISSDGKLIYVNYSGAQLDSDVLYEYNLVTSNVTLGILPNELNLQIYVLAEGETAEDITPQNLNFKITKITKPEIKILSIDRTNYYNPDNSINENIKAYPGSEVVYYIKYTHPSNHNRNISNFYLSLNLPQFSSVSDHEIELTNGIVANGLSRYDRFSYNQENHQATFHFSQELSPGQTYDATLRVKYNEEIPFNVMVNGQEKPLNTFNTQAFIKKEFPNTLGQNIKFYSDENKLDIWQVLEGKISGSYGHNVPGVNIALATVQNDNNRSRASSRIGGDVVISGIDVHDITTQDESSVGRDITVSDKEGSYAIKYNRNKLVNLKLKLLIYFKNVLDSQTLLGETTKLFKPTFTDSNGELLYWKVPIDILGNAIDSPATPKQKVITQNINIYRKDNSWASSPRPEYPKTDQQPEIFRQAAISAENQYWLYNAFTEFNKLFQTSSNELLIVKYERTTPNQDWQASYGFSDNTISVYGNGWQQIHNTYSPYYIFHEFSHYIQRKYIGFTGNEGVPHMGYINSTSTNSYIEGFAYFFAVYLNNSLSGNDINNYYLGFDSFNGVGGPFSAVYRRFLPVFYDINSSRVVKRLEDFSIADFLTRLFYGTPQSSGIHVNSNSLSWINSSSTPFTININRVDSLQTLRSNLTFLLDKMRNTHNVSELYSSLKGHFNNEFNEIGLSKIDQLAVLFGIFVDSNGNWKWDRNEVIGRPANGVGFLAENGQQIAARITRAVSVSPQTIVKINSFGGGVNESEDKDFSDTKKSNKYIVGIIDNNTGKIADFGDGDVVREVNIENGDDIFIPDYLEEGYSFFITAQNSPDYYLFDNNQINAVTQQPTELIQNSKFEFRTSGDCNKLTTDTKSENKEQLIKECEKTNQQIAGKSPMTTDQLLQINKTQKAQEANRLAQANPAYTQAVQEQQVISQAQQALNNQISDLEAKLNDPNLTEAQAKDLRNQLTTLRNQSQDKQMEAGQSQTKILDTAFEAQPLMTSQMKASLEDHRAIENKGNAGINTAQKQLNDSQVGLQVELALLNKNTGIQNDPCVSDALVHSIDPKDIREKQNNPNCAKKVEDYTKAETTILNNSAKAQEPIITKINEQLSKSQDQQQDLKGQPSKLDFIDSTINTAKQTTVTIKQTTITIKQTTANTIKQAVTMTKQATTAIKQTTINTINKIKEVINPKSKKQSFLIGKAYAEETSSTTPSLTLFQQTTNQTQQLITNNTINQLSTSQDNIIIVEAHNFTSTKNYQLYLDNTFQSEGKVLGDGFAIKLTLPKTLKPSSHTITLLGDATNEQAKTTFTLTKNTYLLQRYWAMGIIAAVLMLLVVLIIVRVRMKKKPVINMEVA